MKLIHKTYYNGAEGWYYKDDVSRPKFHREDGPAYYHPSESWEEWFRHGMYHRIDGPAYISHDYIEYWINDINITFEVETWIKNNGLPSWPEWDDEIKTLFKLRFYMNVFL